MTTRSVTRAQHRPLRAETWDAQGRTHSEQLPQRDNVVPLRTLHVLTGRHGADPIPGGPMDGYYAWMLVSSSLVLMMTTPALALFYGGMSRSKSVLNMMMMSFSAMGVVGIVYALWGWSMSYSTTIPDAAGSAGGEVLQLFSNPFNPFGLSDTDPHNYVFVAFQLTFAVITAALISGAIADRVKFSAWLVFVPICMTLSYFPLAHLGWGGGFLSGLTPDGLSARLFGVTDGVAKVFPQDY